MQRTIKKDIALVRQQRNFLLSITHELKTPVAAIKLCLQTLEKRVGLDTHQRAPLQQTALENTERLHNLIDNVLLATRIESGQQVIQKEQTNISSLASDMGGGILKAIAGSTPLDVSITPDILFPIDRNAFESMMVNLVENAVKYGGQLPVKVTLVLTSLGAELKVSDLGPGIPSEERQQIFQKFYRMGNEETRTKKGTGLGLFIVKQLADLHGAKVFVSPGKPSGSEFTVLFPL
jgi:signal transduction histidine kinase